jgi:CheY-like chemotaxis protein
MESRASALVVDDDPINRMLLSKRLEQQGHRVMRACRARVPRLLEHQPE